MYFASLFSTADFKRDRLKPAVPTGSALVGLRADYAQAMKRRYDDKPLSERSSAEYDSIRASRRLDLEALLLSGLPDECLVKAADLVCAVCEESSWRKSPADQFEDGVHPEIDLFAAETALLIAWIRKSGRLGIRCDNKILLDLRARVFTPIIAHDDYPFLSGMGYKAVDIMCSVAAAALICENEGSRLYAILRKLGASIDNTLSKPVQLPAADALSGRASATALYSLVTRMSESSSVGRSLPETEWLDELLASHMGGLHFLDPAGDGIARCLNSSEIYFLGRSGNDRAVKALGAEIYRRVPSRPTGLLLRTVSDNTADITAETSSAPRLRHLLTARGNVIIGRGNGTLAAIHTGGSMNAGDLTVYIENTPMLISRSDFAPIVNGYTQTGQLGFGDGEFSDDRCDMTIDMTKSYPAGAGIRFMQRTAMLERGDGSVRVIDMIETVIGGSVQFRFVTPYPPARLEGAYRMGVGLLRYDPTDDIAVERIDRTPAFPDGLYSVNISYPISVGGNMFNFIIERA